MTSASNTESLLLAEFRKVVSEIQDLKDEQHSTRKYVSKAVENICREKMRYVSPRCSLLDSCLRTLDGNKTESITSPVSSREWEKCAFGRCEDFVSVCFLVPAAERQRALSDLSTELATMRETTSEKPSVQLGPMREIATISRHASCIFTSPTTRTFRSSWSRLPQGQAA